MQCKDIPDTPILELLAKLSRGEIEAIHVSHGGAVSTWYPSTAIAWGVFPYSIMSAMPEGIDQNLVRAKMRTLVRRGLVDGCTCGCRGNFEITEKGKALLLASINSCQAPPIC